MEKDDIFENKENTTSDTVSETNQATDQDVSEQKSERVFVRPQRTEVTRTPSYVSHENVAPQENSTSSIISMCNDLKDEQINEETIDAMPPTVEKKSRGKIILIASIAAVLFISIATTTGLLASKLLSPPQDVDTTLSQSTDSSTSASTIPSDSVTLDIVTNVATDSSLDTVQSGDILTVPQIYEKVSPSTVGIQADTLSGSTGVGTGIIMSSDGYIITNNHVIENADILTVALYDGSLYNAEIIGADETTDLAVIKIIPDSEHPLVVAEFGNSEASVVGDLAITIGNPGGLELQGTLTGGYISAINRDIVIDDRVMTLIQTDAAINPGNSGGPLINQYGQVIGINTIKISAESYEGLGFAIPMNDAKPIIDELIAFGYVTGRPSIGVSGYDISAEQAAYNGIPQGLLVKSVDSRSDAYAKGLKVNDIIVGVNDETTTCVSEINAVKEQFSAGDYITLKVYRSGQYFEIEIMLMDEVDLQSTTVTEEVTPQVDNYSDYYGSYGDYGGNFSFNFPFGN
ncbi:MAG: trypsin-like peptidase domain-containing protein [Clostridia bacterium]